MTNLKWFFAGKCNDGCNTELCSVATVTHFHPFLSNTIARLLMNHHLYLIFRPKFAYRIHTVSLLDSMRYSLKLSYSIEHLSLNESDHDFPSFFLLIAIIGMRLDN